VDIKISPSIMCCKMHEINEYLKVFEQAKLDSIHFDVMDGHFVNNVMLGTNFYEDLKSSTQLPIDIHLMTYEPERFVDYFKPCRGDRVCFHPETTKQSYKLLQTIKELECSAGVVLNPETPLCYLEEVNGVIDYVLIMTVNPGFAGQTMVPNALSKITRVHQKLHEIGSTADIYVDGNTTPYNAREMFKHGATGIVVGTSSILKSVDSFGEEYMRYISYVTAEED